MKELLGQLIAQFLVNVITVAQVNCHVAAVSRRNADATVCSDAIASEFDLCLFIGSHHGVGGRGNITQNSSCIVEPTLR